MKGLDHLLAIRCSGCRPPFVVVEMDPPFGMEEEDYGDWLQVESTEDLSRLDLRGLLDLTVFVVGDRPADIRRFCEQAAKFARDVVGIYGRGQEAPVVYAKGELAWCN